MSNDRGFELGKNKRVTIRRFKNINLIDIREYYLDQSSGDMRPGKKGISLTEEQYDQLIRHRSEIENCLIDLGSSRSLTDRPEMDSLLEKKQKKEKLKKEKEKEKEREKERIKREQELEREKEERANTLGGIVVPTNSGAAVKSEDVDSQSEDAQFETVDTEPKAQSQSKVKKEADAQKVSSSTTTKPPSSNPRLDDHLEKISRSAPEEDDDGDNTMEKDLVKALSQDPHNGNSDEDISEAD